MNAIAQQLGEVGLPAPVKELAARHWDAVVVGGGHNGLTCAAYLARADLPAAARLAARLTELPGLELVECNPVLVHNEGAVVVDAVAKEIP